MANPANMTPEQREEFCQHRKELAKFITAHTSRFYLCEGCEAILDSVIPMALCPKCYGYRFSYDRERLLGQLAVLVEKPPEELAREYEDDY